MVTSSSVTLLTLQALTHDAPSLSQSTQAPLQSLKRALDYHATVVASAQL